MKSPVATLEARANFPGDHSDLPGLHIEGGGGSGSESQDFPEHLLGNRIGLIAPYALAQRMASMTSIGWLFSSIQIRLNTPSTT